VAWQTVEDLRSWAENLCTAVEAELAAGQPSGGVAWVSVPGAGGWTAAGGMLWWRRLDAGLARSGGSGWGERDVRPRHRRVGGFRWWG
ncbi:MAG: hypothetical protein ACRDS0_37485, partial [Pseudonocardiaceae bacterium]